MMMKKFTIVLGILIGIAIIVLLLPYKQVIAFQYENTKNVLAYVPLAENNLTFTLQFTHSIHLSDVVETYEIDNNQAIRQTEISFEEFGIGMPSNAMGKEQFFEQDGRYYIKNMDRIFPFLDIRIAKVYPKHLFTYNQQTYSLPEVIGSGTWVRVQAKKISIWQQLRGVNMLDN